MTGAGVVARALAASGVDTVFALAGGHADAVTRACAEHGVRVVRAPSGAAAAHMAHAFARSSARVGLAVVPGGTGVHGAIAGVAHAASAGAPVVLLGAGGPAAPPASPELGQVAVLRPLVKLALSASGPAGLADLVGRAVSVARGGRPAPVFLDLPADVLRAPAPAPAAWPAAPRARRALADPRAVAEAAALLGGAERPLVLAGSGVHWSGAAAELVRLVERLGAPVIASHGARGVVPAGHPAHVAGARGRAVSGADVALVVGSRLDAGLAHGRPPRWSRSCRVIQVDVDEGALGLGREPDVALLGDARAVLEQLVAAVPEGHAEPWLDELGEADRAARERLAAGAGADAAAIGPIGLCAALARAVRSTAFVACDGDDVAPLARAAIPVSTPGGWLDAGGSGAAGFGIAAASAVRAAEPERQCVALLGDGHLELQVAELAVAARQRLGILVVAVERGDRPGEATPSSPYDLARAVGCEALRAIRPVELAGALGPPAGDRPRVVVVRTERQAVAGAATAARLRVVRS